jgi:hypothetical protein
MPTPEGIITTSTIWTQPQEVVEEVKEEGIVDDNTRLDQEQEAK